MMNDFFIEEYSFIRDNNSLLKQIKYYAVKRFLIRLLANIFVPIWFVVTNLFGKKRLSENNREKKVIVSLTTFPARINRIWIVIECMLRQTYPPDKIVLWLSREQFTSFENLPKNLLKLQKRGLEIEFCDEDLRSHKKYFYTIKKYPNDFLITVDDDFIYPSSLIQDLMKSYMENLGVICCFRAVEIKVKNNEISPYNQWEYVYEQSVPSFNIFFTSGGGTLFPPDSLNNEVLNKEIFTNYCKYADDVWLNIMSQMNHTKVIKSSSNYNMSIPLYFSGNTTLVSINVNNGLNDKQLNDVRDYYIKNQKNDPLKNILN
jgi:hypothetical protein